MVGWVSSPDTTLHWILFIFSSRFSLKPLSFEPFMKKTILHVGGRRIISVFYGTYAKQNGAREAFEKNVL